MIRIIEYVLAKAGDRSVSADSRTKYRQLAKSLSAYIGEGRDEDIIVQARPGWIDGYYRFLCDTYEGNKDRTADPSHLPELRRRRAADHLRTLRRINYNAVAEGILPDVDFLAGIDGPDLSRTRPVTSPDFGTQLRRLIDIRATDSTFAGPIDRYLLCVCLCGLPPGRLPEVLQAITPDTVSVHLPHLGLDLPLGDALRRKALAVKSRRESTHTGQDKGKHSSGNYTLLFDHLGVTLCRSGSPFTDWLSLMMQTCCTDAHAALGFMRLYDAQSARDPAGHDALPMPGTDTILPQAASFITGYESAVERKHYYAVKVYGTSAEDLLADLPASAPDIRTILAGHVWFACTPPGPRRGGRGRG
ncbi:MAG: hypothetical protein K2K37_03495, partial [Muribaculaceae bacterium]|nr:hypothetical protein [Muribaculaceae bacterium]